MSSLGSGLIGDVVTAKALMALEFAPPLSAEIPTLALARRPGITPTKGAGQGHVIRDLRPFLEGDDPRFIDAAASARIGTPHLRSFHEDREGNLLLIADFRRPMLWGTRGRLRSVAAAEVLMRMGWRAMAQGGAVGLITVTDQGIEVTGPRPRRAGVLRVADHMARAHQAALAQIGQRPTPDLDAELGALARHVPKGAMVALASGLDQTGPALKAALARLGTRGPLSLLLIEDSFEAEPPENPLPVQLGRARAATFMGFLGLQQARKARAAALDLPRLRVVRLPAFQTEGGPA